MVEKSTINRWQTPNVTKYKAARRTEAFILVLTGLFVLILEIISRNYG